MLNSILGLPSPSPRVNLEEAVPAASPSTSDEESEAKPAAPASKVGVLQDRVKRSQAEAQQRRRSELESYRNERKKTARSP